MKKLTLLSDRGVLLDNLPAGDVADFLAGQPDRLDDYLAAFRARVAAESAVELVALRSQLTSAHAALDQLREQMQSAAAAAEARAAELTTERDLARAALAQQQVRLADTEAELARLRGKYELPEYLHVVELPAPIKGADHAGIRGLLDKQWRGDLLRRTGENAYALVETNGYRAPADDKVSSLSEITPAQATADAFAYVSPRENVGQTPGGQQSATGPRLG